jgi:protein-tyrosine phosphatase
MNNWYDILAMTQVTDRLFVSGYARAADLAKENPAKITAVLCVHQVMDYEKNPNIIYMHIPFDDGSEIPQRAFEKCLAWLKFMYETGHRILVHCAAGISRSVTILTSFMHYEGIMHFDEALNHIQMRRNNADPANTTKISAKRMLQVGYYEQTEQVGLKHALIDSVQKKRAAYAHPNVDCPYRKHLLGEGIIDDTPRHLIECKCEKLQNPLEIATEKDKLLIVTEGE